MRKGNPGKYGYRSFGGNDLLKHNPIMGIACRNVACRVHCLSCALMKQFWNNVPPIRNAMSPTPKGWYITGTGVNPCMKMDRAVMEPQRSDTS